MRLLIAADIFPPESGGPATYAVTLANELAKRGVDVCVVSLNPKSDSTVLDPKIKLRAVTTLFKPMRYWQYYNLLKQEVKNCDVIYAMGPVNAGYPAMLVAKRLNKKFVVKVVGDYAWEQGQVSGTVTESIDEFQKKSYGGKVGWLKKIESQVVKNAAAVVVPSKNLMTMVNNWGADQNKIKLIHNEVDFIAGNPIAHGSEKWLVTVARLMPWKGVAALVSLLPKLKTADPNSNWKLIVVGDGPEMPKLKTQVSQLGLDSSVSLLGNISKQKTLAYMASADVFVLNSAYEGYSHVLIEAHNQGVPVIASKVGSNLEVITGEAAFDYNNAPQILDKVLWASQIGKRAGIPHRFSDNMIDDVYNLLQKICAS